MARPFCACARDVLPSALFERVVVDLDAIIALHESAARDDDSPASFTAGGSFWRPLADGASADAPVTGIDEAARYLAAHSPALRAILCGAAVGGYEWWWQEHLPDEAPKGLHTDKCVALQPVTGSSELALVEAHPLVSSVLYLTSEGGPTAVFDQTLENARSADGADGSRATPMAAAQVAVCAPRRNRLLLFDGRLLHAVLHRPGGLASGLRKTLLINWWAAQPPGVAAAPRWMLANCAPPPAAPPGASEETREAAEPFELVHLAHDADDVDARAGWPIARAAARFLADVRACWLHQRAPAEVALAYAASVGRDRAPLLLARYEPAHLPVAASEELGSSPREVAVRARRGASGRDCLSADASDQMNASLLAVEAELHEVWPP